MSERKSYTEPTYRTSRRGMRTNSTRTGGTQYPPRHGSGGGTPGLPAIIAIAVVIIAIICLVVRFTACSGGTQEQQDSSAETTQAETTAAETVQQPDYAIWRTEDERKATSDSTNQDKPTTHVCYLTFDDGPSNYTPEILSILDEYGIKATWFVMGQSEQIDYVNDIWSRGHQVAIHTQTHEYEDIYASTDAFWDDFQQASDAVEQRLGFEPTLLRFPGGSVNSYNTYIYKKLIKQAKKKGLHYFDWNVSSGDASANNVSAKKILKNIKKESDGNNSCCVLMHDTDAKGTTVKALRKIIKYYISEGYTFDVLTADSFGYQF